MKTKRSDKSFNFWLLAIVFCVTSLTANSQEPIAPFLPPGYRACLIDYHTFQGTSSPFRTDFLQSHGTIEPVTSRSAVYDPFGGGSQFTIHLAHFGDADWCYPLKDANVISPYGGRGGRQHTGTDMKSFPNDTVLAVFSGLVVMSEYFADYGNCVQIRHLNGLTTLYSHNVKNLVMAGDYVCVGQPVALVGRTGRATTEHVHFEIRVAGCHYNSNLLFDHEKQQLQRHSLMFDRNGSVTILKNL